MMVEYAGQNFTTVVKTSSRFGISGLAHKQPLANVSKSSYRYQFYII